MLLFYWSYTVEQVLTTPGTDQCISLPGVNSDFDFCQSAIKDILSDGQLEQELQKKHGVKLRY